MEPRLKRLSRRLWNVYFLVFIYVVMAICIRTELYIYVYCIFQFLYYSWYHPSITRTRDNRASHCAVIIWCFKDLFYFMSIGHLVFIQSRTPPAWQKNWHRRCKLENIFKILEFTHFKHTKIFDALDRDITKCNNC